MTGRETILARIREALKAKTAPPGPRGNRGQNARDWLPPVGGSFDEQLAAFRQNAAALKMDFCVLDRRDELKGRLTALRDAEGWRKVASHGGPMADFASQASGVPVLHTDAAYDPAGLEQCDAAITECDALIAQTGSVLLTNRSAGGRALSILPPHHIVVARRGQLRRDLVAAFELIQQKYRTNYPTMISLITGPSRTGDIERILVLGAHGPRKLTVMLLAEE